MTSWQKLAVFNGLVCLHAQLALQDQRACLLCGSFKYMTSIRSTLEHPQIFLQCCWQGVQGDFDSLVGGGVNAQLDLGLFLTVIWIPKIWITAHK